MNLGLLEQKLRALPGVLDCSVSAEGVAVVVHPEVDPRLIELQAQVLLAEAGDRRPLLVVGGMTVGPRVLPPSRPAGAGSAKRTGPSPLSLVAFAVLVLGLLAVVPIAGRDGTPDRAAAPRRQPAPSRSTPGALGRVPVDDEAEEVLVVAAGPAVTEPPVRAFPVEAAPTQAGAVSLASITPPATASSAGLEAVPAVDAVPQQVPPARSSAAVATDDKRPKAKGDRRGGGRDREKGDVHAAGRREAVEVASGPPGKADPPGRRRGHGR